MSQFPDEFATPLSLSLFFWFHSHDFTGVKEVHESMKLFGKGIKIGIIDSGVDYTVSWKPSFRIELLEKKYTTS
jgi:hypothetical protein